MQRGVINALKDIWSTLKKELVGPKVNNSILIGNDCKITSGEFCGNYNINNIEEISKIEINDCKEGLDINIYSAVLESKCIKSSLLADNVKIPESAEIIIKNISCNIKRYELNKSKTTLSEIQIISPRVFVKKYGLEILTIIRRSKKMMEIPKKMIGIEGCNMEKHEIKKITEMLKTKYPTLRISEYIIISIFKHIPIKQIKNIKYFQEENILELYFNDKRGNNDEADFLILKEKNTGRIEKLFI